MFKRIVVIILISVGAVAALYLYIDGLVVNSISPSNSTTLPAIYSDSLRLESGTAISSLELIQTLLSERSYRPVSSAPEHEGEFFSANRTITVYLRQWESPEGKVMPPTLATIALDTANRLALQSGGKAISALVIGPQVIARLQDNGDEIALQNRPINEIPKLLQQAVISIEDERFYGHHGLDLTGISRAILHNIMALKLVQGGSTLTQQLAKNTIFTPRRSLKRKAMEAFAAISLERRLSKDQILERYLNMVYLGQEGATAIHGVAEASRNFFDKHLAKLSLSEMALLAGMIQAPSSYAPRRHLERATARRNVVLDKMLELGYISPKQADQAKAEQIKLAPLKQYQRFAPYFVAQLKSDLESSFDVESAINLGLRVYSGLEAPLQRCAEQAVREEMAKLEKRLPRLLKNPKPMEAALVSIEPYSGLIKAWVGGRDFSINQYDHVAQGRRQIGSTIKPFLYLTALDGSLNSYKVATASSILSDEPINVETNKKVWSPENYDRTFHGDVTVRYALENSLNLPAVYIAQRVGIPAFVTTLTKFKLGEQIQPVPALALGAIDTSLLRLTAAYGALANGGIYVQPRMYLNAADRNGAIISRSSVMEEQVAREAPTYVLTDILRGVIERGTARAIRSNGYRGAAAGKTGTSNDTKDAWFVGFTPNLVTGVWVGFDDDRKTGLTGAVAAAPIWSNYMICISQFRESPSFIPPADVVKFKIDKNSGDLAGERCPAEDVAEELYVKGSEPTTPCMEHSYQPEEAGDAYLKDQDPPEDTPYKEGAWDESYGSWGR